MNLRNLTICLLLSSACATQSKKDFSNEELKSYTFAQLADISQEELDDLTLVESGSIRLYVDTLTQNPIIYPEYFDAGQEDYFIHFNRAANSLDILSFSAKKLIKRIHYPSESPLAMSRKSYPFVKSLDSIYIWSDDPAMIMVVDSSGQTKAVFNYPEDPTELNVNMVQHFYVVNNQAIFAFQPPYYDINLRDTSNFLVFDLDSIVVEKSLTSTRPRSVTAFPLHGSNAMPRTCLGQDNSIVTFFGAGPLIIQSSLKDKSSEYFLLRSKYQKEPYEEPEHDGLRPTVPNEFLKGGYFMLVYDQYRQLYYLMSLLEEDEPTDENGNQLTPDDMTISIIIADTLFRYRGEVLLPEDRFFRSMLVTRDGLLVSDAHPNNPAFVGDSLSYTVFSVTPKN